MAGLVAQIDALEAWIRDHVGNAAEQPPLQDVLAAHGKVLCKPWSASKWTLFGERAFPINLRTRMFTCPAGQTKRFRLGQVVSFDPAVCGACPLRPRCTKARQGAARTIHIARDEPLQKRLRTLVANDTGRAKPRERVAIEHRLADLSRKQGRRARYVGTRKNLFDLRRYSALLNLETIQLSKTVHHTNAA